MKRNNLIFKRILSFVMVIFMLAMLLTGVVMTAHARVRLSNKIIANELVIEQIGENFLNGKELGDTEGYTPEVVTNEENKTLTLKKGDKVVLYIEIKDGKVIQWKYSAN